MLPIGPHSSGRRRRNIWWLVEASFVYCGAAWLCVPSSWDQEWRLLKYFLTFHLKYFLDSNQNISSSEIRKTWIIDLIWLPLTSLEHIKIHIMNTHTYNLKITLHFLHCRMKLQSAVEYIYASAFFTHILPELRRCRSSSPRRRSKHQHRLQEKGDNTNKDCFPLEQDRIFLKI